MVEQEGSGQAQARGGAQAVAQLEGHERIEAELLQRPCGVEGGWRGEAQDSGGLGAYEVKQEAVLVGIRQSGQALVEGWSRSGSRGGGVACLGAEEAAERRWKALGEVGEGCWVEASGDEQGLGSPEGVVEQGQALFGRERSDAEASHACEVRVGESRGHACGSGPEAPCEGGGWKAEGVSMMGECIEKGVGGGVVALCQGAEDASEGGEEDEGVEVEVLGERVQEEGGIELWEQDAVEARWREGSEDAIVEEASGVEDSGQGMVEGNG